MDLQYRTDFGCGSPPLARTSRTCFLSFAVFMTLSAIATPLAGDKLSKKLLKLVKKSAKEKKVKRGVKEVVKAIRKKAGGYVHSEASA
jgi:hypothetical protein